MDPLEIVPGKYIGEGQPCFIIAEVGQNHQGDIEIAKKLIFEAKACGADVVKFQKSSLKEKFNVEALQRPYDGAHSWGETYGAHKEHLEFSEEEFRELFQYATKEVGIPMTASAMDEASLMFLYDMEVPFIKLGSGDATNLPLIRRAASLGTTLVISTGMCDFEWVAQIYEEVTSISPELQFVLLQCTSSYPTPRDQVHLRVMDTYAQMFPKAHIGYSGHELGVHISIAAAARGARVIERHITLNKDWKGTDHSCSLEPQEFKEMTSAIRTIEAALGSPLKAFQPAEEVCYAKLGKTVVAARDLTAGQDVSMEDLVVKVAEPKGIPACKMHLLVGRILAKDVAVDTSLLDEHFII